MSQLTIGYYPGCSGQGTSMEYDASTRAVCEALGVTLRDIPDWSCCGSTPAHTVDHVLSTALAARNLAQAEDAGVTGITTPCPSCLKNLKNALHHMEDPLFRTRVEALTERPLRQEHSVRGILQVLLEDVGLDAVRARVRQPLTGLRVVTYYGCLMTRPAGSMAFDDPENPTSMDRILESLGAQVLPFPLKVECCGAAFGIPRRDVVVRLSGRLLALAAELGADAVVVACPLCQMNLDLRQGQITAAGRGAALPVPYFTQLMAHAFGLAPGQTAFGKLAVSMEPVLKALQQRAADAAAAGKNPVHNVSPAAAGAQAAAPAPAGGDA